MMHRFYIYAPNGKFRYNCTIIDLYDRAEKASVNSNYINTDLAIEMLKRALAQEHLGTGLYPYEAERTACPTGAEA